MCPACAAAIVQLVVAATSATGGATALIVRTIRTTPPIAPLNAALTLTEEHNESTADREPTRVDSGA